MSKARYQSLLPDWLQLKFLPANDRCDATYAQIAAIDSYANCVHLFLGPTCEYCVGKLRFFLPLVLIPMAFLENGRVSRTKIQRNQKKFGISQLKKNKAVTMNFEKLNGTMKNIRRCVITRYIRNTGNMNRQCPI